MFPCNTWGLPSQKKMCPKSMVSRPISSQRHNSSEVGQCWQHSPSLSTRHRAATECKASLGSLSHRVSWDWSLDRINSARLANLDRANLCKKTAYEKELNCLKHIWLVVEPYPSWKIWWSSSVGIMKFPTVSGKSFKIPWFQITNQITIIFLLLLVYSLLTTINHHY